MALPENTLPFDRIYEELEKHRQQMDKLKSQSRDSESLVTELRRQLALAVTTLQQGLGLPERPTPLQQVIEEVIRHIDVRTSDLSGEIERQRVEIGSLQRRIEQLEQESRHAVTTLVAGIELPTNRVRSLGSAVAETLTMVQEAKRMIQENL